jgi:hypothetical protein
VQLTLDTERGLRKEFNYRLVNDQLFTPLLTYVSILNTLRSYEREFGAATFTVKGQALVKGHGKIDFEDVFTGESPSMGAAAYVVAPISFLLTNDLAPVELEGVKLSITSNEQPRSATIERVWLDDVRPRPGKTVPLKILTRTYRGEEHIETVSLDIPSNASGTLSVLVSDGSQLAMLERRELRQPLAHESIPQIIRTLNRARKNNRLYVRLLSPNRGAVVNGESMAALPPSMLAVYEADRSSGNVTPLRSAAIGEWEITTDHAISGSRLLTIDLDQE